MSDKNLDSGLEPEIVNKDTTFRHDGAYTIKHPAYGNVTVTRPQGGQRKLFGSDLCHDSTVRLEFREAEEDRHLNRSWTTQKGRILEVEMSEAQWAHFVASAGMGMGTPVTILAKREGNYVSVPRIKGQETERQKASKEYKEKVDKTVEKAQAVLTKLSELMDKGKASKKELAEVINMLQQSIGRFQSDTAFSVDMFEEAMENLVETAKIEIESHIQLTVQTIGAEHLGINLNGTLLGRKEIDDEQS